jgi:hypothetical protein
MKLLNCLACNDVVALASQTRICGCGVTKGRYLEGDMVALICGPKARVIGMLNSEYIVSKTVKVVPFRTHFRWFPILSEPQHNVYHVADNQVYEAFEWPQPTKAKKYVSPHRGRCLTCDTTVESRHNHDFQSCKCGAMSLDGGGGSMFSRRILGDMSRIEMFVDPSTTSTIKDADDYLLTDDDDDDDDTSPTSRAPTSAPIQPVE